MPKASINEQGDAPFWKGEIRPSKDGKMATPAGESAQP